MSLSIQALKMGYKHAAEAIRTGRSIPSNLEASFRANDLQKALEIADPKKIDKAHQLVFTKAEKKIEAEEKTNWYRWAKPRGHRSSAELGAERAFKEFYKGEKLTEEEKKVVLASLAIKIEEELDILKKERDTIRI